MNFKCIDKFELYDILHIYFEDLYLDDFMDYLIVNKLIITNWNILPNAEIIIVYVRKEKGED